MGSPSVRNQWVSSLIEPTPFPVLAVRELGRIPTVLAADKTRKMPEYLPAVWISLHFPSTAGN